MLQMACNKYEASIVINPSYSIAYYYYGRSLHLLAKIKSNTIEADEIFRYNSSISYNHKNPALRGFFHTFDLNYLV